VRTRVSTSWLIALTLTGACRTEDSAPKGGDGPQPTAPSPSVESLPLPLAGERVEIPGGEFKAGSVPGEPGRIPHIEPRRYKVALGPFQIDRLPFPNDPQMPPLKGLTRDEAAKRCAADGGRLCTELEWERACRGPKSTVYSTGETWRDGCHGAPESCASAFDVLGLGVLPEWTASNVESEPAGSPRAALRGVSLSEPVDRRCARREAIDPNTRDERVAFRCCKGPPNAALVRQPRDGQTFEKYPMKADAVEALLRADPVTSPYAKDIVLFREPDAASTVVARGPGDRKGFLFTVTPLLWNPVAGARFLVVSARSGADISLVAVFHDLGEDEFRLAASFIMRKEVGPVALAYNGYIRPRLHFSTCWGCPGETGKILYRDPDGVAILQP
jgi:hypothetical protein